MMNIPLVVFLIFIIVFTIAASIGGYCLSRKKAKKREMESRFQPLLPAPEMETLAPLPSPAPVVPQQPPVVASAPPRHPIPARTGVPYASNEPSNGPYLSTSGPYANLPSPVGRFNNLPPAGAPYYGAEPYRGVPNTNGPYRSPPRPKGPYGQYRYDPQPHNFV